LVFISQKIGADPKSYELIRARLSSGSSAAGTRDAEGRAYTREPKEGDRAMADRALFQTSRGPLPRETDVRNAEGAGAYAFSPKHALAQYAATGCLSSTFYADAEMQLDAVLALARDVEPIFLAKTALFARTRGHMKDMPALLLAVLAVRDGALLARAFPRVVDDGKMLRNFVQIVRSGAVGRKSLGTLPRRLVREWFASRADEQVFRASVGSAPSLADVVKMVHPKPETPSRAALYAWLIDKPHDDAALPRIVRDFEDFKAGRVEGAPDVPFQMLTSFEIGVEGWRRIARNASWQTARMNLNTFARHGVFDGAEGGALAALVAERLRDPEAVKRARVFPYQLLAAYVNADDGVPSVVRDALHDAMETATASIPALPGKVVVCPDVSGSMKSPVTGRRKGATSKVRCVDVAALVAAAVLRKNPTAQILPFEQKVVSVRLEPRDTILTNAKALAAVGGGGTNCSAPLALLNETDYDADLVLFVSDNVSWVDDRTHGGTEMLRQWNALKARRPGARLVCVDVAPNGTTQAHEREDVLNIGGFSDQVFELVGQFAAGTLAPDHWVAEIEKTEV
jgi:60 kDa SS-A/Ro ribonucleoprotein